MKALLHIFSLTIFFTLGACSKDPGYHVTEYREVKFEELPEDIRVPSKAWDLLEMKTAQPAAGHGENAEESEKSHKGEKSAEHTLVFSDVIVYLVQKNSGIVKGEAVKILLPKGGGTVDLADYITDQKGSFYVGFDFPDFETATAKKVLFVSGARKRKIEDKIIGAGCNQFFDITERFFKEMKGEGLKVNTTQERYVSVLGGTFLFSAQKDKDIHVAQVTFKHSQHLSLLCEER